MKAVEKRSLLASFSLFFLSIVTLLGAIIWFDYHQRLDALEKKLFDRMRLCNYELSCDEMKLGFADLNATTINRLHRLPDGSLYADFPIPKSQRYALRITLPAALYQKKRQAVFRSEALRFSVALLAAALLSALFSWFSLRPLRQALRLMERFTRDIVHDLKTPLASIRLNLSMLSRHCPDRPETDRIGRSVATTLSLLENLKEHLEGAGQERRRIDLGRFVRDRVAAITAAHGDTDFTVDIEPATLLVDEKRFARVLDNLLLNAAKHKEGDAPVRIRFRQDVGRLCIENDGAPQQSERIFERFYTEGNGEGLGLSIVKRLSEAMGVKVEFVSEAGQTRVCLGLGALMSRASVR
ncbi:sensor histidine kinase [Hydrogenimonas sp.]